MRIARTILLTAGITALCQIAQSQEPARQADPIKPRGKPATIIPESCRLVAYSGGKPETIKSMSIQMVVTPTGVISSAEIASSSGDPEFDKAILSNLRNSCKTAQASETDVGDAKITVNIPVTALIRTPNSLPPASLSIPGIKTFDNCRPEYPAASLMANEQGTTRVRFTVTADGKLLQAEIEKSSGFARLDEAARARLSQCSFRAAVDSSGTAVGGSFAVEYVWRIE
jgi:TonB family protein